MKILLFTKYNHLMQLLLEVISFFIESTVQLLKVDTFSLSDVINYQFRSTILSNHDLRVKENGTVNHDKETFCANLLVFFVFTVSMVSNFCIHSKYVLETNWVANVICYLIVYSSIAVLEIIMYLTINDYHQNSCVQKTVAFQNVLYVEKMYLSTVLFWQWNNIPTKNI